MPWRPGSTGLPCNRSQVLSRLQQLQARLNRDPDLLEKYVHVVESYISQGHARKVELGDGSAKWLLPHHLVLHPLKPGKVRVVFDCAASYQGRSLNNELLTGPDLLQSLIGVLLLRFRVGRIAFTADIQLMFLQVYVANEDQDFLRFLWWPRGKNSQPPKEYCMVVHLFRSEVFSKLREFCIASDCCR